MGRAPCCEKNGLKKGPWTPQEDQKLIDYIQNHGCGSWRTLPKNAGLQRCGKSCRLRWTNYLRPDIKRGRFSFEEEETIIQLHSVLGNKWSAIAARLPGRTDNEIKNYWNTHIRKRLLRMGIDPVTHTPRLDLLDISSILTSPLYNSPQMNLSRLLGIQQPLLTPELIRLATSFLSSQRENQTSFVQNHPLLQDQNLYQSFQPDQQINPACTTSTVLDALLNEAPLVQPDNAHNFQQTPGNLTGDINQVPNILQENAMASNTTQDFYPVPTYTLPENPDNFNLNNICNQNFNYTSVLSTPSSSTTPLNSCSTYLTTEDERDSYCSDVLKFEVPDIFDINYDQFMQSL